VHASCDGMIHLGLNLESVQYWQVIGRAIAEAVSRWLPIAAARV
jgi:hypothetical protein